MKNLEFEAKALLAAQGLPVPSGQVVAGPDDAEAAAKRLGGAVVVKAQVPASGRMQAGGIRFAATPAEAARAAGELLGAQVRGFTVETVLVEAHVDAAAELFIGVTYDSQGQAAALLASRAGAIEVESERHIVRRLSRRW